MHSSKTCHHHFLNNLLIFLYDFKRSIRRDFTVNNSVQDHSWRAAKEYARNHDKTRSIPEHPLQAPPQSKIFLLIVWHSARNDASSLRVFLLLVISGFRKMHTITLSQRNGISSRHCLQDTVSKVMILLIKYPKPPFGFCLRGTRIAACIHL